MYLGTTTGIFIDGGIKNWRWWIVNVGAIILCGIKRP